MKPKNPLLAESPSLPQATPQPPCQPSASHQTTLLAETNPTTSASTSDKLNQKIYHCPSHGRKYYKYVCSVGHKIVIQRWIPGGDINNRIAQARACEVERWINHGIPPEEIERRIQQWPAKRRKS